MLVVIKDGSLEIVRTNSIDQAIKSLKTLGVRNQNWKREASKLKTNGAHNYEGVNGCSVVVHVR